MSEKKTLSSQLEELIKKNMLDFYKKIVEDPKLDVDVKLQLGQPFDAAIRQLKKCNDILRRAGA